MLQLPVSSVDKLRSYSLENPADIQQVVTGKSRELERATVKEAEADNNNNSTMDKLAEPLALVAVPIVAGDMEKDEDMLVGD